MKVLSVTCYVRKLPPNAKRIVEGLDDEGHSTEEIKTWELPLLQSPALLPIPRNCVLVEIAPEIYDSDDEPRDGRPTVSIAELTSIESGATRYVYEGEAPPLYCVAYPGRKLLVHWRELAVSNVARVS